MQDVIAVLPDDHRLLDELLERLDSEEEKMSPASQDRPCPRCGSRELQSVAAASRRNLLCPTCHRCWTREFGYLIEVNRYACPGCEERAHCYTDVPSPSTAVDSTTARLVDLLGW